VSAIGPVVLVIPGDGGEACGYGQGEEGAEDAEESASDDYREEAQGRRDIERAVVDGGRDDGVFELLVDEVENKDQGSGERRNGVADDERGHGAERASDERQEVEDACEDGKRQSERDFEEHEDDIQIHGADERDQHVAADVHAVHAADFVDEAARLSLLVFRKEIEEESEEALAVENEIERHEEYRHGDDHSLRCRLRRDEQVAAVGAQVAAEIE